MASSSNLVLSYNVTPEELFDLFGKYGPIRYVASSGCRWYLEPMLTHRCSQVRQGIANNTKGTAFVVYEDVLDAKQACDKLNGYNFQNRYLVGTLFSVIPRVTSKKTGAADTWATVLYHQPEKMNRTKEDLDARKENLERLKQQHGIDWQLDGPADSLQSQHFLSGGPSSPTTATSTTSKAASAPRAPKSILKRGRADLVSTHSRRMPRFVRKLLPTVPECA
jgi:pre-mRNA branch site protein p14